MRKIIALFAFPFFSMLMFSCGETRKVSKEFIAKINEPINNLDNKIRFDGVYHQATHPYAIDKYIYGAIIFFDNGTVYSAGSYKSLGEFQLWHQKYGDDKKSMQIWGVYDISSDTISALIFTPYPGGLLGGEKFYECHFQGIIKNRDSILQWHLVSPFPPVNVKAGENEWLIKNAQNPINLYFKNVPVNNIIDPKKAWINKYKIK